MQLMGIEFAPLNIPLSRRLQTLAAGTWFIVMVFGGFIGCIFSAYLIFYTRLWWAMLLYIAWIYYDRNTKDHGGRSNEWIKNWVWWKYFKEYFPIKFERAPWVELDPKKNYLFCCFPHGMICTGPFSAFGSNYGGYREIFPFHKPHVMTLGQHFSMPFFRELVLGLGGCNASAESITHVLSKKDGGNVAVLMVGGASEAFYCRPGKYVIIYNKRKGFIKMALKTGSPLVPVINFGETDLFDQLENPEGSALRNFQELAKKYIGMAPAIPIGRGFFQYDFGVVPKRRPVTTLVGVPFEVEKIENPTRDQVNEVHEKFKQHLINLFEEQKYNYLKNPETTKLEIL